MANVRRRTCIPQSLLTVSRTGSVRGKMLASVLLCQCLAACGLGGGGVTPIRTPFNKGVYHYSAGRWDAAVAEFRLAMEEDEDDYRSRFNLAMALEAKARAVTRSAVASVADGQQIAALKAEAESEYTVLTRQRPESVRVAVNLAALEYESGREATAKKRLQRAIEAHPGAASPLTALGAHHFREMEEAASHSEAQEKLSKALALLERAVDQAPANVAANMLLGEIQARRREPELAREAFRRALERDPSDIGTLLALARLESGQGEHAEAVIWAQRAVYVDPNHVDAHLVLATAFEAMEDSWNALFHFRQARELDHGPEVRRKPDEYRTQLIHLLEQVSKGERDARGE